MYLNLFNRTLQHSQRGISIPIEWLDMDLFSITVWLEKFDDGLVPTLTDTGAWMAFGEAYVHAQISRRPAFTEVTEAQLDQLCEEWDALSGDDESLPNKLTPPRR